MGPWWGFFETPMCIGHNNVEDFCACSLNMISDMDGAMKQMLVEVGGGTRTSSPVGVDRGSMNGGVPVFPLLIVGY